LSQSLEKDVYVAFNDINVYEQDEQHAYNNTLVVLFLVFIFIVLISWYKYTVQVNSSNTVFHCIIHASSFFIMKLRGKNPCTFHILHSYLSEMSAKK
jgi:uncharacterized membrane protein (DUF485 family)